MLPKGRTRALNKASGRWDAQLFLASANGDLKIVRELLSGYANPNARDATGKNALHWAAVSGHVGTVECLVGYGRLWVDARDKDGCTPLHLASFNGHFPVVECLVKAGAVVDAMDGKESTALLFACRGGHLDIVKFLIEHSAKVNIFNALGQSPLEEALKYNHSHVSRFLRSNLTKSKRGMGQTEPQADPGRSPTVGCRTCAPDSDDPTLGDLPCDACLGIAQLPLEEEGSLDASNWLTPLNLWFIREHARDKTWLKSEFRQYPRVEAAASKGDKAAMCCPLEQKESLGVFEWTETSTSSQVTLSTSVEPKEELNELANARLLEGSENGELDKVRGAIASGADPEAQNGYGLLPLHEASRNGHVEVVEFLLDHNAEVNAKDREGARPLHHASAQGHLDVVLLLLVHGASVDAVDSIGASALHSACQFNRFDCVQCLVKEGADVDIKDRYGVKPVQYVEGWRIVDFLANLGAR